MDKKVKKRDVVISVLMAIVWSLILFDRLSENFQYTSGVVLAIITAVLWWINALVWSIRYKKSKEN